MRGGGVAAGGSIAAITRLAGIVTLRDIAARAGARHADQGAAV
jgi:ribosomal protein S5